MKNIELISLENKLEHFILRFHREKINFFEGADFGSKRPPPPFRFVPNQDRAAAPMYSVGYIGGVPVQTTTNALAGIDSRHGGRRMWWCGGRSRWSRDMYERK